jgi:hypothetical protein
LNLHFRQGVHSEVEPGHDLPDLILLSSLGEQRFAGAVPGRASTATTQMRRRRPRLSPQQLRILNPQQSSRKHSSKHFRLVGAVLIAQKLAQVRLRLVILSAPGMQSLQHEDRRAGIVGS